MHRCTEDAATSGEGAREPDDARAKDGTSRAADAIAARSGSAGTGPDESDLHNTLDEDATDDQDRFDAG